jgi:hypothetical protein
VTASVLLATWPFVFAGRVVVGDVHQRGGTGGSGALDDRCKALYIQVWVPEGNVALVIWLAGLYCTPEAQL